MTTTAAGFEVGPIGTIGAAEIIGLDCSQELSPESLAAVRETFQAHPVLVFRNQLLTPPQQRRFTEQLGPIEEVFQQKFVHPDDPLVLIVTNELKPDGSPIGVVDAGDYQHTDGQIFEYPTTATLLYSVRNPQTGGDTEFANMYLAYDAVPDELKREIASRTGTYHVSKTLNKRVKVSAARPGGKEFYESQEAHSAVHHPLVRTHPETKRKALYVSPRFTLHVDDMDEADSDRILDQLFAIIAEERFKYRHHWGTNDLVMWDNRCMTHRATGGYALPDIRRMHRTTIKGTDRPAYVP